ncbi:MAG: hypothetical protein U5R14_04110 [Gemmatimonadota bacterium]|nr:hypothetical protein [Gemmatimonadota bacterium]
MSKKRPSTGSRPLVALSLLLLLPAVAPTVLAAQGSNAGTGWRVGITFGGISTVGVTFEAFRDSRSIDVTLGTFSFRDVGVSVVGKQYVGGRAARPFVGIGLWGVLAASDEGTGLALVARMPIGVDWTVHGRHSAGASVALNRALAVRRPDPTDERPLNERLVPLPGIYYRWTH